MKTMRKFFAIAAISIFNVSFHPAFAGAPEVRTISVQQAQSMKEQGALILDVREPSEYDQQRAPGTVLIPLGDLKNRINEIRAFANKPIAIICRSGNRSGQATDILNKAGFTNASNIQGGMIAWEKAGLPVIKGKN